MPERLAYDEAMQFSALRLKIPDPELKQGRVELVSIATAQGLMQRPWGIEGGFAVVYKFRRQNDSICALRCFRVPMSPDMQFRYERIGPYFHLHAREITAGFKYYDEAIVVKEQGKPQNQKYPVIEMDWIDGVTLVEKLNGLCVKRQHTALQDLATRWIELLRTMEQAHIAHGDLAGVNVMVCDDGRLVLIDYDGVYIPEFAGLPQVLLGQEDFQHPQMAQRRFSEHMDAFSALVIYVVLIALAAKPELWDSYTKRSADGKLLDANMLFRRQDFQDPQHSLLFRDLERLSDAHIKAMVRELKHACRQSINDVRFPFALVDPEYREKQALHSLEGILTFQDDERIAAAWLPLLDRYAPAQRHRSRVQLAQQRVQALLTFRQALATGNLQYILNNYESVLLDDSRSVTSTERQLLSLAPTFLRAYRDNNDDALELAERLQSVQGIRVVFTPQQQQRITQMRQRRDAQQALSTAFNSRAVEQIAALAPLLQYIQTVSDEEQASIKKAAKFIQVYGTTDASVLLAAFDALQMDSYPFVFTLEQQQRVTDMRRRQELLAQFRDALASRSPWRIVKAFDPLLDGDGLLNQDERERLELARLFVDALRSDDDDQINAADSALQQSSHRAFFHRTNEEEQRFKLARQKRAALVKLRTALHSKVPRAIVAAYDTILDESRSLTREEREQVSVAQLFVHAIDADDDIQLVAASAALQRPTLNVTFILDQDEQQRLSLAQKRLRALDTLHKALSATPTDAQQILAAYDASLLDASGIVTKEERETLAAARSYLSMLSTLRAAMQAADDDLIRGAYEPTLAQRFSGITPIEQQHIDRAMLTKELEELLDRRDYEQALHMAHSIQKITAQPISDMLTFKLKRATMRFIREHDLSEMSLEIEERADGNYATVSWRWPASTLIQTALITWQSEGWPARPSVKSWNDPRWHGVWTRRKNNVLHSSETFPIGKGARMYVIGYAALLDAWEQEKVWRFSDGSEPTSYAEADSPGVTWHIQ